MFLFLSFIFYFFVVHFAFWLDVIWLQIIVCDLKLQACYETSCLKCHYPVLVLPIWSMRVFGMLSKKWMPSYLNPHSEAQQPQVFDIAPCSGLLLSSIIYFWYFNYLFTLLCSSEGNILISYCSLPVTIVQMKLRPNILSWKLPIQGFFLVHGWFKSGLLIIFLWLICHGLHQ